MNESIRLVATDNDFYISTSCILKGCGLRRVTIIDSDLCLISSRLGSEEEDAVDEMNHAVTSSSFNLCQFWRHMPHCRKYNTKYCESRGHWIVLCFATFAILNLKNHGDRGRFSSCSVIT